MQTIRAIVNDTLKRGGKWSRTSLTMLSAWLIVCFIGLTDFFFHGFNSEVFFGFLGAALGSKISDSFSKKLHNENKH